MLKGLNINHGLLSFFISLLGINSSLAAAFIASDISTLLDNVQPIFTLTAGGTISQLRQSQSFAPLDLCSYNYKSHSSKTNMLLSGFIGSEVQRFSSWGLIAGLGYYQQPNALLTNGTLTQGADPASNNIYNYRYQTQSQQLLTEGKLYWIVKEKIQPFLMVGIGAASNKISHYQTNVPPFLEFTPAFSNHTQINFTYAVGPGIDISLTKSFRVGIGYRFTDLGSATTGSAQIDAIPISSKLKQSHLYTNQILAQLTFIPWAKD